MTMDYRYDIYDVYNNTFYQNDTGAFLTIHIVSTGTVKDNLFVENDLEVGATIYADSIAITGS